MTQFRICIKNRFTEIVEKEFEWQPIDSVPAQEIANIIQDYNQTWPDYEHYIEYQ